MPQGIVVHYPGGLEVLKYEPIRIEERDLDEAVVNHKGIDQKSAAAQWSYLHFITQVL